MENLKKRPQINLEEIWNVKPLESDKEPVPGLTEKWPEVDFMDHKILEKRTFHKDRMVKIANYRFPAIDLQKPKGIIFLIHGFTDHLLNKAHIAKKYAEAGYDVVGLDLKGFGRSEGYRCYIKRYEDLINEHLLFEKATEKHYKEKLGFNIKSIPIFVSGLSMGGGIAMQLAIRDPERYQGIIMFAPAIRDWHNKDKGKKRLAKILKYILPKIKIIPRICQVNTVNRNHNVFEYSIEDPYLYSGKLDVTTGNSILKLLSTNDKQMSFLKTPFIIVQGMNDKLIQPDSAWDLLEKSQALKKDILWYPKVWHDVWRDNQWEEIMDDVVKLLPKYMPDQQES